jgi:FkbM family methyltransferase
LHLKSFSIAWHGPKLTIVWASKLQDGARERRRFAALVLSHYSGRVPTIQDLVAKTISNQHVVDFGAFKLAVNTADGSGARYRDETRRDELTDPLMADLVARLKPHLFLDLGANYGFTSMLHNLLNPEAAVVAVEMSPLLTPFIRKTFLLNQVKRGTVVEAACGDAPGKITTRLNLHGSADNRVIATGGKQFLSDDTFDVAVVTIDQLLADLPAAAPVLIKIDTQGYERHVFAGAHTTLSRSPRWAIKTEFGPAWLKSQSTEPKSFLRELVERYDVAEWPQRPRFKGDRVADLLRSKLRPDEVDAFVDWLAALNLAGRGWCDLLITPKNRDW